MKVAFVCKYPPIEGGESTTCYWTARSLADAGHDVFVVTNSAEVEAGYREHFFGDDANLLEYDAPEGSVRIIETTPLTAHSYIPWARPFLSQLLGRVLEVIQAEDCDAVLGSYFEPYALVACLAGMMLKKPVVVRHAGSDVGRLSLNPDLSISYKWLLSHADGILASSNVFQTLVKMGAKEDRIHLNRSFRLPKVYRSSHCEDIAKLILEFSHWCDFFDDKHAGLGRHR